MEGICKLDFEGWVGVHQGVKRVRWTNPVTCLARGMLAQLLLHSLTPLAMKVDAKSIAKWGLDDLSYPHRQAPHTLRSKLA